MIFFLLNFLFKIEIINFKFDEKYKIKIKSERNK